MNAQRGIPWDLLTKVGIGLTLVLLGFALGWF